MEEVIVVFEIADLQNIYTDLRKVFIHSTTLSASPPLISVTIKNSFSATMFVRDSSGIFILGEIFHRCLDCTDTRHIHCTHTIHTHMKLEVMTVINEWTFVSDKHHS